MKLDQTSGWLLILLLAGLLALVWIHGLTLVDTTLIDGSLICVALALVVHLRSQSPSRASTPSRRRAAILGLLLLASLVFSIALGAAIWLLPLEALMIVAVFLLILWSKKDIAIRANST